MTCSPHGANKKKSSSSPNTNCILSPLSTPHPGKYFCTLSCRINDHNLIVLEFLRRIIFNLSTVHTFCSRGLGSSRRWNGIHMCRFPVLGDCSNKWRIIIHLSKLLCSRLLHGRIHELVIPLKKLGQSGQSETVTSRSRSVTSQSQVSHKSTPCQRLRPKNYCLSDLRMAGSKKKR